MPGARSVVTGRTPDPHRRALLGRALSLAVAVAPFGVAFGALSTQAGLDPLVASGYSLLVFTGSAQFAAVAVLYDGGTVVAAVLAGLLLNLRCLAFGIVMSPAFPPSRPVRAIASQLMIDEAMAVGTTADDPAVRWFGYLAGGIGVFVTWNVSTLAGAVLVPGTGTFVRDLGIDATIPAAFLALLWPRLRDPLQRRVAVLGALIALALVPVLPIGVPIIVAGAAVPVALRMRRNEAATS